MKAFSALILVSLCFGCASNSLSDLERRNIEAKEFEGTYDNAFKATMQVLQDKGFVIENTDFAAGVIRGKTGKEAGFWGRDTNYSVSATLEQFGANKVKERIVVLKEVRANMGQYGFRENSDRVDDPEYLQGIYEAIKKEIFVRENLNH